jgi:hypothetical protein
MYGVPNLNLYFQPTALIEVFSLFYRSESGKTELKIILDHLPSELFKRTMVRGKLDLVGKFPFKL